MFKFLAFIFIIGLFGFLIIGVLLGRAIRFFGPADKNKSARQKQKKGDETTTSSVKKFSKNEGEYVNYEEIKEEE